MTTYAPETLTRETLTGETLTGETLEERGTTGSGLVPGRARASDSSSALAMLTAALDALVGLETADLGHGESLVRLLREASRVEAVVARGLVGFEASGEFALDGARDCSSWVVHETKCSRGDVRRLLGLGRACRELPGFRRAWCDGTLSTAQLRVVAAHLGPRTRDALVRDEQMLLGYAHDFDHRRFARLCGYWAECADPDGSEESAQRRRSARDVTLCPSLSKMYLGRITLDEISGAIVAGELERLERILFEQDHAAARERLGRAASAAELSRTAAQRRADALVEMATRSRSTPADARRPLPLVTVLVGYETLHNRICELESGTIVAPGSLLPLLCHAEIERAVFSPERRVEIGARTRLFSGATRRAIEVRDRSCTHPYCDQALRRCEVDHIVPYASGGETTQENGRLLCGFHNRLRNREHDLSQQSEAGSGGRPPPAGGST